MNYCEFQKLNEQQQQLRFDDDDDDLILQLMKRVTKTDFSFQKLEDLNKNRYIHS